MDFDHASKRDHTHDAKGTEECTSRLFDALVQGDRRRAKQLAADTRRITKSAEAALTEVYWPLYMQIERLFLTDQLTPLNYHLAIRHLSVLVSQNARDFQISEPTDRRVLVYCGRQDNDLLGAEMVVDFIEARGLTVRFPGGHPVKANEILRHVIGYKPNVLLMFSPAPEDLPEVRSTIDTMHVMGLWPEVQIAVGGGVFARVAELAEEIGADVWGNDPVSVRDKLDRESTRRATASQQTVGRSAFAPYAMEF